MANEIDKALKTGIPIPSTFEKAEKIVGRGINRNGRYAIIGNNVYSFFTASVDCSYCFKDYRSKGCPECNYTGKRIAKSWVYVAKAHHG